MKNTGWVPVTIRIVVATFVLSLIPASLLSQGGAGRIAGTIADQTGAVIAGATVTVVDVNRGTSRPLTTDHAGAYNAPNLIPGTYNVRAELKGFKTTERQNIVLEVGQELRVDLTLLPGETSQTITVTEEIPLIETTNAELGGTIQNRVINDLPLNGRNFINLLALRPGVMIYAGGSGWTQSSNGLRPHDNYFLVNGINSNDPWMAQSIMNAVMAAGDAGTLLPIDAIDEFRTVQNPDAQYGWKPGSVVNVGIKAGTNSTHGSAYAYGRTDSWDARDYFNFAPQPVSPLQLEQFGGSIGGAIKKDKLFYFANFEQQHYEMGNPAQHLVPITQGAGVTDSVYGLIGACKAVGAGLTPLSAQLAGLDMSCNKTSWYPGFFPSAAGPGGGPAGTNSNIDTTNTIHSGIGRLDYHLNDKNTFYGSYFISQGLGIFADNPPVDIAEPWLTDQYARAQVLSTGWVWAPKSNWTNELRGGYSHYYQTFLSNDYTQNPANYNFQGHTYNIYTGQTLPAYFGLPQILWQGGYSFEFGKNWPKYVGPDGVLNLVDHVSYQHGTHTFMFGGEFLDLNSSNNVAGYVKPQLRFHNLQSFFDGTMNRTRYATGNFARQMSNYGLAFFFQDSWRMKPRLTVNYGLRWEYNSVMNENNDLMGNFDPSRGLVQLGNGISSVYQPDHRNFAPRLGIAWDIFGDGKTVLRAGGGITYEQFSYDTFNALGNLVGLRTVPTGVTLAYTDPATGQPVITKGSGTINTGALFFSKGSSGLNAVNNNWQNNSANSPLFSPVSACGDGSVSVPLPGGGSFVPQPCTILGVNPNLRTPYVTTWTLDLQRAITNNLSLDVAYIGNHGTKLLGLTDLNQPAVGAGWGNPKVLGTPAQLCLASAPAYDNCNPGNELGPYATKFPYLGAINWLSNGDESNYDGLQVTLTQRTAHGLSFIAGYTYSHALDMASDSWAGQGGGPAGLTSPIDSSNPHGQLYGNSIFDITHRFTLSTTYAIPGIKSPGQVLEGWSINSIVKLESGAPWGINDYTTDFSGTGEYGALNSEGESWDFFGNAADFHSNTSMLFSNGGNGGIPYYPGTSNSACLARATAMGQLAVASLTNLGCYAVGNSVLVPPAFGSLGTAARNMFRGMPFYNWDLSVTKRMQIKERLTAQFRAEFFNVLNHPNFANVYGGPGGDNTYTDPSADAGVSFGFRPATPDVLSSNPILGSGGPRAIQLGLKLTF